VARMRDDWQHSQQDIQTITQTTWTATLDTLSKSFAQLSQIAGGCLGGIFTGIGSVIGALDTATKSVDGLKGGFLSMTSGGGLSSILGGLGGILTGIGGIVAAAEAAVAGIKKLFE